MHHAASDVGRWKNHRRHPSGRARGDGSTLNTAAVQKAIDDCAAAGGGTIQFPAGRYLTGTIQIKSNVTLRLDEQAALLGSTDAADYQNLDPLSTAAGSR